jgi:2-methylisocitrate lyase-like PEP mutase family enzyme
MSFRELHFAEVPFLLPNAWDVSSALAFVTEGFPAIGTTSLGIAGGLGMPDGTRSIREATLQLAQRLRRLQVPLNVDVEDGFSDNPTEVANFVRELGCAGVNIEDGLPDGLADIEVNSAKIAAIKGLAPDVFVNARVDTYWTGTDATVKDSLYRAHAYLAAGADGIFVPGDLALDQIRSLADQISAPLNVLASTALTVGQLHRAGAQRISTGSLLYRTAIDAATNTLRSLREGHTPNPATHYNQFQQRLQLFHESTM